MKPTVTVDTLEYDGRNWVPFVEIALADGYKVVLANFHPPLHEFVCLRLAKKYNVKVEFKNTNTEAHFFREQTRRR